MSYKTLALFSSACLFVSWPLQAFQVQYRAYHSSAKLTHKGGSFLTTWNEAFLQGPRQVSSSELSQDSSELHSPGHELIFGTELFYPHFFIDFGAGMTQYFAEPSQKIEDLTARIGLQALTNVQDRWMPYFRIGLARHQLKLESYRVESTPIPFSLGLKNTEERFAVKREWLDSPELWNVDLSVGCKLFPVPTTAIVIEYRYSDSLSLTTIREKANGISSLANEAGFVTKGKWQDVRLLSQELSLGIEVEL